MDKPSADWRPKCRGALHRQAMEDDEIVLDQRRQLVHQLNSVAAFILSQCNGTNTPEAITRLVLERFLVDADQARTDVATLLKKLQALGLID